MNPHLVCEVYLISLTVVTL